MPPQFFLRRHSFIVATTLICSKPRLHLRRKLPYSPPSGCCLCQGNPSSPRAPAPTKRRQTAHRCAYVPWCRSYHKRLDLQPYCLGATYVPDRRPKLRGNTVYLPRYVLSCTYRRQDVENVS